MPCGAPDFAGNDAPPKATAENDLACGASFLSPNCPSFEASSQPPAAWRGGGLVSVQNLGAAARPTLTKSSVAPVAGGAGR